MILRAGWRVAGTVLLGAGTTGCGAAQQSSAVSEWPLSTPAAQNVDAGPINAFLARARAGEFGNVDRVVIVRNGHLIVDERFDRDYRDISRGRVSAIGCGVDACTDSADLHQYNYLHPDYHPWWQGRDVHAVQSVTKSVAATVIGVAIARGDIAALDLPLLSFLDAYDTSRVDPRLSRATLRHLLTMQTGIEWHEDRPLGDTNTTIQLERSDDWIRFTLAQPMDAEPGEKWVYNSGGSQLISEVIRHATGEHVDAYANRYLFEPLGIRDFHWKSTPTGHPDTEGGLFLEARDLARIGQLYLDDGMWRERRILPAGWARDATSPHVARTSDAPGAPGYGYQWWWSEVRGHETWSARGFGGNFLIVIPALRIVGVVNAWNVFGDRAAGVLGPFTDALLDSANEGPT